MRILTLLFALGLAACAPRPAVPDASAVIAAERAFAAEAGESGWVEAFIEYSTEDALLLGAGPTNAHAALSGIDPANRGDTTLSWGPDFAGMSRGGDFGFTTGPYNGGGEAFGQYFTVWRRQADGSWKWIFDGGVNGQTPTIVDAEGEVAVVGIAAAGAGSANAALVAIDAEEAAFAEAAAGDAAGALETRLTEGGRVNREDMAPASGAAAAAAALPAGGVRYGAPQVREAAAAGDMVFTLGEARWDGGSGYFARIWVLQEDGWRIAYDQIALRPLDDPEPQAEPAATP